MMSSNPLKKVQKNHPKSYLRKTFAHSKKVKKLIFLSLLLITFFARVILQFEISFKFCKRGRNAQKTETLVS